MDVLLCLMRARGRVVTREELLQKVWPRVVVNEEVLTRAVSELRTLLGDTGRERLYIATVPKRGYKLLLEAVPLQQMAAPGEGVDTQASDQTLVMTRRSRFNVQLGGLRHVVHQSMAALGYVLVVYAAYFGWNNTIINSPLFAQYSGPLNTAPAEVMQELQALAQIIKRDGSSTEQINASTRILVQPLVTITDDSRTRIFAAGLDEDLKHALSTQPAFRVVSQIREDVRASDLILNGSVRVYESHARINLQIIEVQSARLIWSRSFETTLDNMLEAQANIATRVSRDLGERIRV
jgi:TolB-like protein